MQITVDGVPLSLSVRFASRQQQDETQRQTRIDCSNGPLEAQHNLINYDFQASYRSVPLVPTVPVGHLYGTLRFVQAPALALLALMRV
jgi:hypothetical protein